MTAGDYTVNPQSAFGEVSSETLAGDKNSGLAYYKSENKVWRIIGVLTFIVSIISLILACYGFTEANKLNTKRAISAVANATARAQGPSSCQQVIGPTGIYYIKTDTYFNRYPVYCDMDTNGGGWTLVASIHENNIQGKCSFGDKWSSDQGFQVSPQYNGTLNWENKNIFGTINSLSNDDYKNMGYFAIQAQNVMLWHVPNGTPIQNLSSNAFLKYYTNNNFLMKYGGNLQTLYANFTPLVHAGPSRFFQLVAPPVVFAKGNSSTIMNGIPNSQKQFVETGYMQFRTFDPRGFPNALCPGVRMISGNSAQVCVGGGGVTTRTVSGFRTNIQRDVCGDFAGWGGNSNDPGSQSSPSNSGRSIDDINSSIFVFVK